MGANSATCQCGALQVHWSVEPDFVIACNCKACQRRTGAPFGAAGYFKISDLKITGDSQSWRRTADSGRWLENHFCPTCGTTLYWLLEMRPDHAGVALGAFDGKAPVPSRAIWTDQKHDWVAFPDDWPQFPQASPPG
ncbi:MAG: GFA family protein [Paracoccaceae bacterium]|nr:GFA family protein [Paracoccaceae bacterium]